MTTLITPAKETSLKGAVQGFRLRLVQWSFDPWQRSLFPYSSGQANERKRKDTSTSTAGKKSS